MFSALKKLVGSEQAPGRDKNIPAGLQSMNQALQRRFAKGVQYNMKIVIRGDRNTGKTALWHRLQGRPFVEEYIPTQEIQVTSIHWSYKTTDDIVKVEVWDVVDKGKCKKRGDGLKMENDPQEAESDMALDAEFLDVYKSCNGVVMMFDITKQWTFNYILRELPKVPTHVPVCVLGNYRDMGEHRVILPDDVRDFIDNLDRPPGSSYFRYAESSMKNSFGLKYLHKFFNIPFLQLQRETLLRQLETNQLDMDATLEELSVQQETEDQNYGIFLEMMEARSRGHASPLVANGQSPSSGSQSPVVPPGAVSTGSSSPGTPQPAPQLPLNAAPPSSVPPAPPSEALPPPACPSAPAPRRSIISRWPPPWGWRLRGALGQPGQWPPWGGGRACHCLGRHLPLHHRLCCCPVAALGRALVVLRLGLQTRREPALQGGRGQLALARLGGHPGPLGAESPVPIVSQGCDLRPRGMRVCLQRLGRDCLAAGCTLPRHLLALLAHPGPQHAYGSASGWEP
uniref:Rab-like protein 6 n=1 Tax=Rhinopithecus roxellana TaxID=61622 RepID=A0A2K6RK44_RHIRO